MKKKDYTLWSDTAGSAEPAHFSGEETLNGLKVYQFITEKKDIPYDFDMGLGVPVPVVLDLRIEEKVEPHTGITVYGKSTRMANVLITPEMTAMLSNPAVSAALPDKVKGLVTLLPKEIPAEGLKMPVMIVSQQYSPQTIAEKVSDAKHYKTQLLWATVYGLWLGIGLGIVCLLAGAVMFLRSKKVIGQPPQAAP